MAKIEAFENYIEEYDDWFHENENIFLSEINAVKEFIPFGQKGLEIGVGSGKFTIPLGITIGVEPSLQMAKRSRKLGINVIEAVAEDLPFSDGEFDFVLMVTAVCFFDNVEQAFKEAYRVLKPKGVIIVAHIDKGSQLGQQYQINKGKSKFYKDATFYSVNEITQYLQNVSFSDFDYRQTIFTYQNETIQPVESGFGKGSFAVVKGIKTGIPLDYSFNKYKISLALH